MSFAKSLQLFDPSFQQTNDALLLLEVLLRQLRLLTDIANDTLKAVDVVSYMRLHVLPKQRLLERIGDFDVGRLVHFQ